ncbi:hypothetical protein EJP77_13680 [Paenibacillus zeisoli]|uniref:Uncharacterized protein n=1 Tax=Paenibacillus zeisoli TaxID=2496267 RepID=A0A433X720_9BACL|nr:hypothetical protein [Paenibacillus zeisoli]RUT29864.1 hypothetical protein EJP77_13680 [Paenibacillus zeisoli]
MGILVQIFISIYYAGVIFACMFICGHKSSGGDERQKEIRKRATQSSWIGMMLYSIERGIREIPFVKEFYKETVTVGPFIPQSWVSNLQNGFDVVLVGFIFYIIFYIQAKRKLS